ncbi:MAG: hypothetical protein NZO58_12630, partial [Gemmataceae bacterium]|nr:hypothetical protein [Gemmataceae bacterium]
MASELEAAVYYPPVVPPMKPGRTRTQRVDDAQVVRWLDTDISGLYRVVVGHGPQEIPFAVNVPAATPDQRGRESDLTRVDYDKLRELLPGWDFPPPLLDPRDAQVGTGPVNIEAMDHREPVGPEIAHWLLLALLILLFVEIVLAWRFGHYSAVHGTTVEPETSLVLPSFVAVVSLVLFLGLALILGHAWVTGDFLGFLPSLLRNWFERLIGATPTPPGEESRWELGGRAVFFDGVHDSWYLGLLAVAAVAVVVLTYRADGPNVHKVYKALLGGLRLFVIWLTLGVLLPQLDWRIDRLGWPDLVVLIDTSRSMGEADQYHQDKLRERAKQLGAWIQPTLKERLPARIKELEDELEAKKAVREQHPEVNAEIEELDRRLRDLKQRYEQFQSPNWQPTRLQLVQALLAHQPELDWLKILAAKRRMKVRLFQLDVHGRASKIADGDGPVEVTENHPRQLGRAHRAVDALEAEANDSRLGTALRQVIDQYRGAALAGVVMLTDGVTTRDETIGQVAEYAAQKGVPLYLVGIGDDHEIRDLKLHDLVVDDSVFVNDKVVFEARLTGKGYKKDFSVPVVLKVKDKSGKEVELKRTTVRVNPLGKAERFKLTDQPKEPGRKQYIIEVETPKSEKSEKQPHAANLRLERTIDVMDAREIKILYVEGQPRYEYRYLKFLLEREAPDAKGKKVFKLATFLLDADPDFASIDQTAIVEFPRTMAELLQYDVVILGDVNPFSPKIGEQNLKNLVDFVRGEDAKGNKIGKGGGLLLMAGAMHNPHSYRTTPLAAIMPIEPDPKKAPEPPVFDKKLRLELTLIGRMHPIFRFSSDDAQNMQIFQRLAPLYWWSHGYRLKPLAEVLAVHPELKGDPRDPGGHDGRLPLVVQQFVGGGRVLFF